MFCSGRGGKQFQTKNKTRLQLNFLNSSACFNLTPSCTRGCYLREVTSSSESGIKCISPIIVKKYLSTFKSQPFDGESACLGRLLNSGNNIPKEKTITICNTDSDCYEKEGFVYSVFCLSQENQWLA